MDRQLVGEWLDFDETRFVIWRSVDSGHLQLAITVADKGKPLAVTIDRDCVPAFHSALRRHQSFVTTDADGSRFHLRPAGDEGYALDLISHTGRSMIGYALLFAIADQMAAVLDDTELPAVKNG